MLQIQIFPVMSINKDLFGAIIKQSPIPICTLYAESDINDIEVVKIWNIFKTAQDNKDEELIKYMLDECGFSISIDTANMFKDLIGQYPNSAGTDASKYSDILAKFIVGENCNLLHSFIPKCIHEVTSETVKKIEQISNGIGEECNKISYRNRAPVMIFKVSKELSFLIVLNDIEDGKRLMRKIQELKSYEDKLLARTIFRYMLDKLKPTIIRSDNSLQIEDYTDNLDASKAIDGILFDTDEIHVVKHYMSIPRLIEQVNEMEVGYGKEKTHV